MGLNDLTPKQKLWIQRYCEIGSETFGNATKSALVAYELDQDSQYQSARQIGWENMTKLDIHIRDLMNEVGLSNAKLLSKLLEGLEASKRCGSDGIMYPDNNVRLKALELAFKIKGELKDNIIDAGGFFSKDKLEIVVIDNHSECDNVQNTVR